MRRPAITLLCLALSTLVPAPGTRAAPHPPARLDDGWEVAAAAGAGWDTAVLDAMDAAIASGQAPGTTSVLIVHEGRLVHERYFGEGGPDVLNNTRSATKSVTALLVGAAIDRGLVAGTDARVYDFFADRSWRDDDPRKRRITIEDLLTMSAQWECNDENEFSAGHEERMYLSADWTQFVLDLPVRGYAPWMPRPHESPYGRAFAYCTANAFLLGAILERVSGRPLAAFAHEVLEAPLGIRRADWLRSSEGVGMGGGGTGYRTRDLARFGQLLVDGGRWRGRQVVPSAWIRAMTTPHAQAREDADYGYLLWRLHLGTETAPREAWAMAGNGGNYVFVLPGERLVVVVTRTHYNQRDMHAQSQRLLTDYVLRAMPRQAAGSRARERAP